MAHLSPALRHQARVLAELAASAATPEGVTTGSAYELMLRKLADDRRRLKNIQSVERKIDLKVELLPEYQEWIAGVLAAGKGAQDDVLTTVLVWYIDAGEYEQALTVAAYAVEHKMTLPDQYNRDIPTMLLDEFAGAYLTGKLADDPVQAVQVLNMVGAMTAEADAPDQARAKLCKAYGYALTAVLDKDGDVEIAADKLELADTALRSLKRALSLFDNVGVKKDIEKLERRIKRVTDPK